MYNHYVKSLHIQSFLCPYFSAFGLSTERYSVFLDIQSKCRKVLTRKIPNTETFHAVNSLLYFNVFRCSVTILVKCGKHWSIKRVWNPFKIDKKNTFYFTLKALFVLDRFNFLSEIFGHLEKNGLIRKIWLISKFITSHTGWQTITIHILPKISWSKGNQTMKFGQLIEYNKKNTSLQNLNRKWTGKTSSRPFFVFWKALNEVQASGLQFSVNILR